VRVTAMTGRSPVFGLMELLGRLAAPGVCGKG
jgi:hypothetical protein